MKRALLLSFLLGAATLIGGVEPAQADEKEAESCLRTKIWDGYSDGWRVRTATSATLAQAEYRIYLVTLYKGNEYKLFACGDAEAKDVGLVLHDSDGNVLVQDEGADREPLVSYTPTATDTYFVVVHASQLNNPDGKSGIGMAVTFR